MIYFLYIFLWLLTSILIVQNQLVLACLSALLFTYYRSAVWLIPLGFFIDGYFDAFFSVPVYTIVSILWYIISESIKPRLRGYTT